MTMKKTNFQDPLTPKFEGQFVINLKAVTTIKAHVVGPIHPIPP